MMLNAIATDTQQDDCLQIAITATATGQWEMIKSHWGQRTPEAQKTLEALYSVHHELAADVDGCLLQGTACGFLPVW